MNWKNTKLDVSERRMWFAMEHPNWKVLPKTYDEAVRYIEDMKVLWPKGRFEIMGNFEVVQTGM